MGIVNQIYSKLVDSFMFKGVLTVEFLIDINLLIYCVTMEL